MESLGISLAALALVSIGAIAAFAFKLVAAHAEIARRTNEVFALNSSNAQLRDALRSQEIKANKETQRADNIEVSLMELASVAGEPAVRGKLHQIWTDRIRAAGREHLRAVPNKPATDTTAGAGVDIDVLGDGAVPDYDEFTVGDSVTVSAPTGALDPKRLGKMFKK